jgi:predicted Zn finger-like uncharacterized protein
MTRVTTTCPQCATIFRVNPEQLAARRGQVRCGRCRHVFNGYETVSVGPDLPEAAAPAPQAARPGRNWLPRWLRGGLDLPRPTGVPAAPPVRAEGLTKMVELVRSGPTPGSVEPGALRVRPAFGIEPERVRDDFSLPSLQMRRRLLKIGIGAAVVALPVVLMLARNAIVQAVPAVRPAYQVVCQPLHCQVPLPSDADAWSVESNELLEDPNVPQLFHFSATLRNRSHYAQAFPTLDLSLTDTEGLAVDRRVVAPAQWLPAGRPAAEGLAPNAEVSLHVDVKAADRRSQGYRVVLFFPP